MPIDASIPLQVKQPQMPDMGNQLLKILQIQGLQDARTKEQRALDQQTALNDSYSGALGPDGKIDENRLYSLLSGKGQGSQIPGVQKSLADVAKTKSETDQNNAKAESDRVQAAHTRIDVIGQASAWVRQNPTPENAVAATQHLVQNGILTPEQGQASIARIQADPSPQTIAQNADMAFRSAVQAKDQLPKLTDFAAGDRHVNQAIDPITGKVTETGSTVIGQSADNKATNATSVQTTGMNNASHIQGINIQQAGENSRSAATLKKDFAIAGVNPDGTPTGNMDSMIDMLGQNRLNPSLALQRLSGPQRANIISQVQAKYPGWDETTYDAKKGAAQKFTYGDQGNQLRSNATATAHLDQLEQLATALNSGNIRVVNQIANAYGLQTGAAPAQVFNAVKNIVGQEVVKSIVAGGGGEGERKAAADAFDAASSPQQFLQTKAAVRHVMKAQADNLLAQRRAAGLPDSTLPNYNDTSGGGTAAPAGWSVIGVHK